MLLLLLYKFKYFFLLYKFKYIYKFICFREVLTRDGYFRTYYYSGEYGKEITSLYTKIDYATVFV